jgi:hypothetical protein
MKRAIAFGVVLLAAAACSSADDETAAGSDAIGVEKAEKGEKPTPRWPWDPPGSGCSAEVEGDDETGDVWCGIQTYCGGWGTQTVVTTGPWDDPPCACECR